MFIQFAGRFAACVALLSPVSLLFAQQTSTASPDAPAQTQTSPQIQKPSATPADKGDKSKDDPSIQSPASGTSKDRLFYALPNFLTLENAGQVPPLTTKQKYGVVARSSFDPVQFPWYGFLSGISQAEDSEPGYGQGAEGYGKRFGASFADGTIENFMTGAVFPSLLRQDPRFFQSGKGSFFRRSGYAVSRVFVTRGDNGHSQFNSSEILGSALSAAISTYSYHPKSRFVTTTTPGQLRFIPSDRTLTNTASVWGSEIGYDTITFVVKEFWPDIHRKMSKKHKAATP